nr:MAG TPA: hypothetical protein [Caudoviricetes sp.]DAR76705.1 MAG TPA: hypothetical protein [Caudoviricetes sp.]DAX95503.1 MAG TPA: hypothetical protein [Caudoviricetes sp.]
MLMIKEILIFFLLIPTNLLIKLVEVAHSLSSSG